METLPTDQGDKLLKLDIRPQPDDVTCGPTCLHAAYQYFGDNIPLSQVIDEVHQLYTGGTLAVNLGDHALARGYKATIYTYNLQVFDPSWFPVRNSHNLVNQLKAQLELKDSKKLRFATETYIRFLELGGRIRHVELNSKLIIKYLKRGIPILTGLSATYLYNSMREIGETNTYDSIEGEPAGHFVVVNGISRDGSQVYVADPLHDNPMATTQYYKVGINRLINSIMLGILTYDANILILEPSV